MTLCFFCKTDIDDHSEGKMRKCLKMLSGQLFSVQNHTKKFVENGGLSYYE